MRRNVTELLDIQRFAGCNMWVTLGSRHQTNIKQDLLLFSHSQVMIKPIVLEVLVLAVGGVGCVTAHLGPALTCTNTVGDASEVGGSSVKLVKKVRPTKRNKKKK